MVRLNTRKINRKKGTKKTKKKSCISGGKVIDAGGFGCVFKPALRCANRLLRHSGISKLERTEDAVAEWQVLQRALKYIKRIPNYKRHFLLDHFTLCRPAKLTVNDKKHLTRCSNLRDINIDADSINDNLAGFAMINMPYGGINLETMIRHGRLSFRVANTLLMNLLEKAIRPMNRLNIYHTDLKANNILYKDNAIKIIDFGELVISQKKGHDDDYDESLRSFRRPIQFNSPLSSILLLSSFESFLSEYLANHPPSPQKTGLGAYYRRLSLEYYKAYTKRMKSGKDHTKALATDIIPRLNKILGQAMSLEDIIGTSFAKIMLEYVDIETKTFRRRAYIEEVYKKKVDVYGLLMCYLPFTDNTANITPRERVNVAQMVSNTFLEKVWQKPRAWEALDLI